MALFLSVPCYADQTGKQEYFKDCEQISPKYKNGTYMDKCTDKKGTEFVKPTQEGLCKPEREKVYCAVSPETFQYTTVDIFYDYFSKKD